MADLELVGPLDLVGTLDLVGDGGKVVVGGVRALVENAEGKGIPVVLPPPPASPLDTGTKAVCLKSLGAGITAGTKTLVTTGLVLQGDSGAWPGMLTPSTVNTGPGVVTANGLPVNVVGDSATIFPNGAPAAFSGKSGQ
jgi:hypothetical protein